MPSPWPKRSCAGWKESRGIIIPDNIHVTITRNYGETAKEKSNELLLHMFIAVFSVTILIWLTLGRREAGVVALAIPVTLALTLAVFYLYGYTLNRITLFALIFSIGILVDDAIVVVENVVRHFRLPENKERPFREVAVEAVDEVGNPTILATLTVIAAILPMAFVGGLMGPYMRPIPVGATFAMVFSLLVAFIVTPWASVRLLRHRKDAGGKSEPWGKGGLEHQALPSVDGPADPPGPSALGLPAGGGAPASRLLSPLCCVGWVQVKMLPFDNKSEFQVIIDMPESATLEKTTPIWPWTWAIS